MEALDIYTGEVKEVPFFTQRYVPLAAKGEKEDSKSITETAYIPPQVQIADMMQAGVRLAEERRARFDSVELSTPDGEDPPLDPLREPGLDLSDLSRLESSVSAVRTAMEEQARVKAKEESDAQRQAEINAAVEKVLAEKAVK